MKTRGFNRGMFGTGVRTSWCGMMARCRNPKSPQFKDYGGRGIVPCPEIEKGSAALFTLIGHRPEGMSLDRPDNNEGYNCGSCEVCIKDGKKKNVRWATRLQQNRNQRDLHQIEIRGVVRCMSEWAEALGINYYAFRARVARGVTGESLITAQRLKPGPKPETVNKKLRVNGRFVKKPA